MKVDNAGEEATSSSTAGSTVRFEIKKWNAVTMWAWDICADTCAICRNSLNEPSIEYVVSSHSHHPLHPSLSFLPSSFLRRHELYI